ncbi:5-(carboxyamino)imidazole ribonucleotide mutase [Serpentinicella alkaliphila]|uniref:N5-carboxyaminoimidazole ribonucleotide mutase n=1 Tax=Serpentinicella alkaliphila TaxID=1734049 RepID=A0A4R2TIJ5_9FIRM|nr:5-(carboxyamino)imidazole ribonucleotide mutase [Serpentinicella alkaliphila]QUH24850.1 5-(carboxyamino)imidazole ribonucleotide mutase [Serpentinicella alkaliphila]TCQ03440.1 5-(carboxyamino)imidazole ribonucleotide mutase [Serpentinicella alkaliphila]
MRDPLVSIIMGSDSDLPIMKEAAQILDELSVPYECTIVSAHRTPDRMFDFAKVAESRGIKVIIAGAGGAAHLPGMVASLTNLPVIGVPVKSKSFSGVDSLYSIVQMPPGIPVATVAIDGAKNAGILAAQIVALENSSVKDKVKEYKDSLREMVEDKAQNLEKIGYEKYLSNNK